MIKDITEIYDEVPIFAVDETGKALITEEQYSWLCNYAIRMAERVQKLEDIIYKDERQAVIEGLYEENKRYREALEFYADDLTYTDRQHTSTGQLVSTGYFNIMYDNGEKARRALEGEE